MGWGKELELARQKKLGLIADGKSDKSSKSKTEVELRDKAGSNHTSSIALVAVVGAAAVAHTLWKKRAQLLPKLFPQSGGGSSSGFRFPHANKNKPKAAAKGIPAAGPPKPVVRDDNLPRNKAANNKKNKNRKKEKREQKQLQQAVKEAEVQAQKEAAEKAAKNTIPKDEDIVGGELGKTFTTTSHIKVSKQYAKIRDTVGKE
eukprot:9045950-Pyramimonas_sp.AAC.1